MDNFGLLPYMHKFVHSQTCIWTMLYHRARTKAEPTLRTSIAATGSDLLLFLLIFIARKRCTLTLFPPPTPLSLLSVQDNHFKCPLCPYVFFTGRCHALSNTLFIVRSVHLAFVSRCKDIAPATPSIRRVRYCVRGGA